MNSFRSTLLPAPGFVLILLLLPLLAEGQPKETATIEPQSHIQAPPPETAPALPAGITLVWCPAGEFNIGTSRPPGEVAELLGGYSEWFSDEQPSQVQRIDTGFWISAQEITRAQWETILPGATWWTNSAASNPQLPATGLTWRECISFATELGRQTDQVVRLPNEKEWEYACRAGTNTLFFYGDDTALTPDYANSRLNIASGQLEPVGQRKPNPWGLYDMLGNAWEWCADTYTLRRDSEMQSDPSLRVVRGGSFLSTLQFARCAYRSALPDDAHLDSVGFRIVVEINHE